jgi:hypothetical protein
MSLEVNTQNNRKLDDHINYNNGTKTVCVSTCLSFFGIEPDTYHYTSSKSNLFAYDNVLRKNGFSVRSKASEFKMKSHVTSKTALLANIKKSSYTEKDFFIVSCVKKTVAHLIVVNGLGKVVIDTSPSGRWKVRRVKIVEKL